MTLLLPAALLTLAASHPGWWSIPLIVVALFQAVSAFLSEIQKHEGKAA